MVEASSGDGEHLGVTIPISVHIEMTGEADAFVEVGDEPDPAADVGHIPPLQNMVVDSMQGPPLQHDALYQNDDNLGNSITTPEYVLSQNVKEYEEYDDGEMITNVVVTFNSKLLYSHCKPSSPMYDDSM